MGRTSNLVGQITNFSIQYNLSVLSLAIKFMTSARDTLIAEDDSKTNPDFPEPVWASETLLSMVFTGTIIGMSLLGYVGDAYGRRIGLLASVTLVLFGSLGSALLSWGSSDTVYLIICIFRLIIGIGVGGMYPNGAALSAEGASEGEDDGERVGWSFFWQQPGAMAPGIVAYIMLLIPPSTPAVTSIQFRIMLALGSIPAAIVWIAAYRLKNDLPDEKSEAKHPFAVAAAHPQYFKPLAGTTSSWFLWDITCYGTSVFTPAILSAIFVNSSTLSDLIWQSLVLNLIATAGVYAAIIMIKRFGATWIQFWGFLFMASIFALFAVLFIISPTGLEYYKFGTFCLLFFSQGWGPNLSTYVLPAQLFPSHVKSTFHGLSAAAGKVGAVVGTLLFMPVKLWVGIEGVMWANFIVCILGAVFTRYCLPDTSEKALIELRKDWELRDKQARQSKSFSGDEIEKNAGDDSINDDNDSGSGKSLLAYVM
jgi:PHS family inorganic phosphate transporter-like MFS transporter